MSNVEEFAELIDEIAGDRCDTVDVWFDLDKDSRSPTGLLAEALRAALLLDYADSNDWRRQIYGPFVGISGPKPVTDPVWLSTWEDVSEHIKSPAISGRLRDLLWIDKFGDRPDLHARGAIADYLSGSVAQGRIESCHLSQLQRAHELLLEIRADDLRPLVSAQIRKCIKLEFRASDADQRPGIGIRLLSLLAQFPDANSKAELAKHLETAKSIFADQYPSNREGLIDIEEILAESDQERLAELQRERIQLWIDWSRKDKNPMLIHHALERALDIANATAGEADLRRRIRQMLQEINWDEAELEKSALNRKYPQT